MCGSLSLTHSLFGGVCVCECVLVVETIKIVKRKSQLCGNYYAQQSCLVAHHILVRVCPRGCHRHRSDLRRVASTENWKQKYKKKLVASQVNIIYFVILPIRFCDVSAKCLYLSIVDLLAGENRISIFPPLPFRFVYYSY